MSTYFSAFKWLWLLENVEAVQAAKAEGHCMVGTMDSWLMYNLTGGVNGVPPPCAHHTGPMRVLIFYTPETVCCSGAANQKRCRAYQQHKVLIRVWDCHNQAPFGTIRSGRGLSMFRLSPPVELQRLVLSCHV